MMNRKAQLDQIIMSIILLFASFFLSGLFAYVSSNVAAVVGYDSYSLPSVDSGTSGSSQALLDVFLTDQITVEGRDISVRDAIPFIGRSGGIVYARAVEHLFIDRYACDTENVLIVTRSGLPGLYLPLAVQNRASLAVPTYINYPAHLVSDDSFGSPETFTFTSFRTVYHRPATVSLEDIEVSIGTGEALCVN